VTERRIYLDNNATTPLDERVVEAMLPVLRECFGNPSSTHAFGEEAADLLEAARAAVARLIGARSPAEIVFTSGGTESINTALHAVLRSASEGVVLTSATEHAAVASALERHARRGLRVEAVGVDGSGRVALETLLARIAELGARCRLVTVHWANNETGVLLRDGELDALVAACREREIPVHLDAVQVPGKLPVDVAELGVDLLSISAHKFHGPKGAGALFVRGGRWRRDASEDPSGDAFAGLIVGGAQEDGRRAGTPNVPGLVGMGRAAELARAHAADPAAGERVRDLRDRLEAGLVERVPGARVNGAGTPRLPNTTSVGFPGVDGELLLMTLAAEGLAVSGGAACSARRRKPSHVLLAMGLSEADASSSVRLSLSRRTTPAEVEAALELVPRVVGELRALEAV